MSASLYLRALPSISDVFRPGRRSGSLDDCRYPGSSGIWSLQRVLPPNSIGWHSYSLTSADLHPPSYELTQSLVRYRSRQPGSEETGRRWIGYLGRSALTCFSVQGGSLWASVACFGSQLESLGEALCQCLSVWCLWWGRIWISDQLVRWLTATARSEPRHSNNSCHWC